VEECVVTEPRLDEIDLLIVGGGPAGLEAALIAARARLRVRVVDEGRDDASLRRNAQASLAEGTIGLDHVPPSEVRARARQNLTRHGVEVERDVVTSIIRDATHLVASLEGGSSLRARRVLLASGLRDVLSALPGLAETWGRSSFSCPYCHGYERSGPHAITGRWGVLAHEVAALKMAPLYTRWAREVVLFTDGLEPPAELRRAHEAAGLAYVTEPCVRSSTTKACFARSSSRGARPSRSTCSCSGRRVRLARSSHRSPCAPTNTASSRWMVVARRR
jgi:thioredoxin reductase